MGIIGAENLADDQNVLSFQTNESMERLSIVTVIFLRELLSGLSKRNSRPDLHSFDIHFIIFRNGKFSPFPPCPSLRPSGLSLTI